MTQPDPRTPEAEAYRRWYKLARWKRLRAEQLRQSPLCAMCAKRGRTTAACIVDHVKPHRGDPVLFWDAANLQSLCKPDHDGLKQAAEHRGYSGEVGLDGIPLDPSHPWNTT